MNIRVTAIKYCNWCGRPFEVKSPNQKYCPANISNCSKEAKRESWRKASEKYRKAYKDILPISQVYKLGSGLLSSNSQIDFDKEYLAIQKEKKRLKLSCIGFGFGFWIQFAENLVDVWTQFVESFVEVVLKRSIIPVFESYPQLLILFILIAVGVLIFGVYHEFGVYNE